MVVQTIVSGILNSNSRGFLKISFEEKHGFREFDGKTSLLLNTYE